MNSANEKLVNAWIYMGEKDPVINGNVVGYKTAFRRWNSGILLIDKKPCLALVIPEELN